MRNNKLFILGVICACGSVIILCWVDASMPDKEFSQWLNISQNLLIAAIVLVAVWTFLKLRK